VSLYQLVEPANTKIILEAYLARSGNQSTAFIRALLTCLISLARHRVRLPAAELEQLVAFRTKLFGKKPENVQPGLTRTTRALLRQLSDPSCRAKLLALPGALAASARQGRASPARRLLRMRTAVAIELLLLTGVRLAALADLRVGKHLIWPEGRG